MRLKRICKSITCIVMSAGFVFTGIPHTASYDAKKWETNLVSVLAADSLQYSDGNTTFKYEELNDGTIKLTECVKTAKELIIPAEINDKKVSTIGLNFTSYNSSIEKVSIPEGVTTLDSFAFDSCENLESINIPSTVTFIGHGTFRNCSSLKEIEIPDNITRLYFSTFEGCSSLESVKLPENLTQIDSYVFRDCSSLIEISIPENLVEISGDDVFSGCSRLKKVKLPSKLTNIKNGTFYNCMSLTDISFPSSVKTIGDYAFSGCSSLTVITLPDNIEKMGKRVFKGCINLEKINLTVSNANYIIDNDAIYEKNTNNLVTYTSGSKQKNFIIKDGVTEIDAQILFDCINTEIITLPESLVDFKYNIYSSDGMSECENLKAINISDNNTLYRSIDGVLYSKDLSNLIVFPANKTDSYVISDKTVTIGNSAFAGNDKMTSIDIPSNVKSIESMAFGGCKNLKDVKLNEGLANIGSNAFIACDNLENIEIPDSVQEMASGVFLDCKLLKNVKLSSNMKVLEDTMFYDCFSLENVIMPLNLEQIYPDTFTSCHNLKKLNIPESVKYISNYAVVDCINLESITIPSDVNDIGEMAFGYILDNGGLVKKENFKIYGADGSTAQRYANDNNFEFIEIKSVSSEDGIKIEYTNDTTIGEEDVSISLVTKELSNSDPEYAKINFDGKIEDTGIKPDTVQFIAYEISLKNESGVTVQPDGNVLVKIPVFSDYNSKDYKVYYVNEKGQFTNMNAEYQSGYVVFTTKHFSTYLVTRTNLVSSDDVTYGDANGDGKIDSRDAVVIKKYVAGFTGFTIDLEASDVNADGKVDTRDAVKILKKIAGFDVTLGEA